MSPTTPQRIALWPGEPPGSAPGTDHEQEDTLPPGLKVVRNVSRPSMTAHLPDPSVANGTAVIVCPGGAFHFLSIDMEGNDVARWLSARGVAAFVLRYRLVPTGEHFAPEFGRTMASPERMAARTAPVRALAAEDGRQAVRVVRQRAAEFGVQTDRIGLMGFSAGGVVTAAVAAEHDGESRPDFLGVIYGAPRNGLSVPADAPPLFVLCADDDAMAAPASVRMYADWRAGGHSAELHIYSRGGHGFGMRTLGLPSDSWIDRFGDWLHVQGLLGPDHPGE